MNENTINQIKEILKMHNFMAEEEGRLTGEIYIHYNDEVDESEIINRFNKKEEHETYTDVIEQYIGELEFEYSYYERQNCLELINQKGPVDATQEEIQEFLDEYTVFVLPHSFIWEHKMKIELGVDAGDSNYDYCLNTLNNDEYNRLSEAEKSQSGIVWLATQQGYKAEDIYGTCSNSKLIASIKDEVYNATTDMCRLEFLLTASIEEICTINDRKAEGTLKEIVIPAAAYCGLIDHWYGAGSDISIELEKDVVIPSDKVRDFLPDECIGQHSISSIYGLCSKCWNEEARPIYLDIA